MTTVDFNEPEKQHLSVEDYDKPLWKCFGETQFNLETMDEKTRNTVVETCVLWVDRRVHCQDIGTMDPGLETEFRTLQTSLDLHMQSSEKVEASEVDLNTSENKIH